MDVIYNPRQQEIAQICRRNRADDDAEVTSAVMRIMDDVAVNGDEALRRYAEQFDGIALDDMVFGSDYIHAQADKVDEHVRHAIDTAAANIRLFHQAQVMSPIVVETQPGVVCQQRQVPIDTVGLYIPGGQAPLFSTVLMLAIPAAIAGCRQVVLCTPYLRDKGISPEIAYAALACGIDRIYAVGGAQAIAAMTYGTQTVPRVNKIFGPGNRYVTKAKQLASSLVAIDMLAGPSEVLVMADSTAAASYVAADLLSQAEHGADSQAMMVTDDESLARQVVAEVERQTRSLSRQRAIAGSLSCSHIVVMPDRAGMIDFANSYAAEHLIISMQAPWAVAAEIHSAGSVFIGNFSPESAGDYASGTNHTLPTSGLAHAYSGVNLDSFMKKITYQQITRDGLRGIADVIVTMADAEGLDAHAAAVKIRIDGQRP